MAKTVNGPNTRKYPVKRWVPTAELRVVIGEQGPRIEQKFLDTNNERDFIWRPLNVYYEQDLENSSPMRFH